MNIESYIVCANAYEAVQVEEIRQTERRAMIQEHVVLCL